MAGTYDRIAKFYDADMARNMAFDDIGFYASMCARRRGAVLEMGCGNGRILLPLLERGVDAFGIDASARMLADLRRKAADRGLGLRVAQMDARALALRAAFDIVLCTYSFITNFADDADLARMLAEVRRVLVRDGLFVVDAFVPRTEVESGDFRLDYRRPFGEFVLARSKRVAAVGAGRNRIERRYQVLAADGSLVDQVDMAEVIRPFTPDALRAVLAAAGFETVEVWWDYASQAVPVNARFFSVVARRRREGPG